MLPIVLKGYNIHRISMKLKRSNLLRQHSSSKNFTILKRSFHQSHYLYDSKPIKDDDPLNSSDNIQKSDDNLDPKLINDNNNIPSSDNKHVIDSSNEKISDNNNNNNDKDLNDNNSNPFRKLKKRIPVFELDSSNNYHNGVSPIPTVDPNIHDLRKTIFNVIGWSGMTPSQKFTPIDDNILKRMIDINIHAFLNDHIGSRFNKIGFSIKSPPGYSNSVYGYLKKYAEEKDSTFLLLDMNLMRKVFKFYYEKKMLSSIFTYMRSDIKVLRHDEETALIIEELFNVLDEKFNNHKKFIIVVKDFELDNEKSLIHIRNLIKALGKPVVFINIDSDIKKESSSVTQQVVINNMSYIIKEKEKGVFSIEPIPSLKKMKKNMTPKDLELQRQKIQQQEQQNEINQTKDIISSPLGFDPIDISDRILNPQFKESWDKNESYLSIRSNLLQNLKTISAYLKIMNINMPYNESLAHNKYLWDREYDWSELRKIILNAIKVQMIENSMKGEPVKAITHLDVDSLNEAFFLYHGLNTVESEEPKENVEEVEETNNKEVTYTAAEQKILKNLVEADKIETTFDDIGSLLKAKEELMSLLIPLKMKAFKSNELIKTPTGILLYGPPGTGKTMLARALAKTANAFFIHISASTILSKWLGESEENVAAIFSLARKKSPSIIFIDEVDGLLQARDTSDHESTRRVKNEFFSAWDGLLSKDENADVTVICATNRPFDLDQAALRRLPHRVLVPLPDKDARREIFAKSLKNIKISMENNEGEITEEERNKMLDKLAEMTERYSGSDIRSLCVRAALQLVRDFMNDNEYNELLKSKEDNETLENIAMNYALRPITMKEFEIALKEIAPSVDPKAKTQMELAKWHQVYGHNADKKKSEVRVGF